MVGRNFGCGSSREHAVWAVMQAGFRAIIAPGPARGSPTSSSRRLQQRIARRSSSPEADRDAIAAAGRDTRARPRPRSTSAPRRSRSIRRKRSKAPSRRSASRSRLATPASAPGPRRDRRDPRPRARDPSARTIRRRLGLPATPRQSGGSPQGSSRDRGDNVVVVADGEDWRAAVKSSMAPQVRPNTRSIIGHGSVTWSRSTGSERTRKPGVTPARQGIHRAGLFSSDG